MGAPRARLRLLGSVCPAPRAGGGAAKGAKDAKLKVEGLRPGGSAVQTGHMGDRSGKRPTDTRPPGTRPLGAAEALPLLRGLPVFVSPPLLGVLGALAVQSRAHVPPGTRPIGEAAIPLGFVAFVSPPLLGALGVLGGSPAGTRPDGHTPAAHTRDRRSRAPSLLCSAALASWRLTLWHTTPPRNAKTPAPLRAPASFTAETSSRTSGADRLAHSPDRSGPSCCGSSGSCRSGRWSRCHFYRSP